MGQTLSEPVTAKETTSCSNDQFLVGSSCMQGWRINMEDSHTHILSLAPEDPSASFFAVYDGHGGAKVAAYAGDHLHRTILQQEEYKAGKVEDAIRKGFLQIDQDMLSDSVMREELAGSTAIAIIVKAGKVYVGNVGDSRAVASFAGVPDPLSIDHKPSSEGEAKRINAAGGWVEFNRVNGNLALSRALGDFVFKRNEKKSAKDQIVTAFPDVQCRDVSEELEFIVIACDGIWDVLSNEEVIDFVRRRIAEEMEPSVICEELMTRCLAPGCQMGGLGCDNMTVILICFLNGRPYKELAGKCRQPQNQKSLLQDPDQDHEAVKGIEDEEETTGIADSPDSNVSTSSSSCSSSSSSSSNNNSSSLSTATLEQQGQQQNDTRSEVPIVISSPAPVGVADPAAVVADPVIDDALPEVHKATEPEPDSSPQTKHIS